MEQTLVETARKAHYILGPEVQQFEQEFGQFLGGAETVMGVGNGYDALVICLKALGIGPGDEVIVPSNGYRATVNAVLQAGATPVLAEPDALTYNMTAEGARKVITSSTKALLPVHLYGQACEMEPLLDLAKAQQLFVIEDAAQAHGAAYKGKQAGTFGHCNAFSFYPTKNLGALGDGGAVVTADEELAAFVRMYRNYGERHKYQSEVVGVNSRLDELQAAVLRVKLWWLEQLNAERQRLAGVYLQKLQGTGDLLLPVTAKDCSHCYHIFCIRTSYRDQLQQWLTEQGVQTAIHYPVPVHLQAAYRFLNFRQGDFPVAEELAATSLSLPLFPGLREEEQARVVQAVKQFFESI